MKWILFAAALSAAALTGCAPDVIYGDAPPPPPPASVTYAPAPPPPPVYAYPPPPAPLYEPLPPPPFYGAIWVPGVYYHWHGGWRWHHGYYRHY